MQSVTIKQSDKLSIIWIDRNINSPENKSYLTQLGYISKRTNTSPENDNQNTLSQISTFIDKSNNKPNPYIHPYDNISQAINYIKQIKFIPTFIIISGSCFKDFVKEFDKNLKNIYVIPKIIIFTSSNKKSSLINEI